MLRVHQDGLGDALAFVVAGALAGAVDVAPVVLRLRVHQRIAVDLRRAGVDDPDPRLARLLDEADGADGAGGDGGVGIGLVVEGRRRAREVEDDLGVGGQPLAHVADLQVEVRVATDALEVRQVAGHQVVEPDHLVAFREQPLHEVRADEAGGSGHEYGRSN